MKIEKIALKGRKLFARNMKSARMSAGISQEELAELVGLHRTYIGSVERCERNISIDNIERIALALSLKITDLLVEN